jgi:hypothetical protein
MPLRDVQLSDDAPHILRDRMQETRRELHNAYERIEDLERAIRGLLSLTETLSNNPGMTPTLRDVLKTNERVIDARELLR